MIQTDSANLQISNLLLTPLSPTTHSSDEKNCFTNCPLDEDESNSAFFHCASGDKECIPIEQHCNGVRNCQDGSDEIDCGSINKNNALHKKPA